VPNTGLKLSQCVIGGALGALSRYAIDRAVTAYIGPNVFGIFLINIIGSFLLGIFVTAYDAHDWPMSTRLLIAVGFFGSYTTFSTLTVASVQLAQGGDIARAALNILGSIAVGLAAALAGILVGRVL
jgi:CrcB protein